MISVIISVTLPPDLVETHQRKVTPKRPPVSFNPSLIDIFCRKWGERPNHLSMSTNNSHWCHHQSSVTKKCVAIFCRRRFSTQVVSFCDTLSRRLPCWTVLPGNSLVEIRLSVAFIYFFYWINIYFVLNSCFIACVLLAECPSWTLA